VASERLRRSKGVTLTVSDEPVIATLPGAEQLFKMRYTTAYESSTGLERAAFNFMGRDVIRSLTLTLDVFSPYEAGYTRIAPVNRTRIRSINPITGLPRRLDGVITNQQVDNSTSIGHCDPDRVNITVTKGSTSSVGAFTDYSITKDTTRKSRPIGAPYGEFESSNWQQLDTYASSFSARQFSSTSISFPLCPFYQKAESDIHWSRKYTGPLGRIPSADAKAFLLSEVNATKSFMASKSVSLLPSLGAEARRATFGRNAVELRDLPRSVIQLRDTLKNLLDAYRQFGRSEANLIFNLGTLAKDIPKEYLGFHFGWKQTYRDIMDLLTKPEKVTKEINYLITRSCKPTTFRRKVKFTGPTTTSPGFSDYQPDHLTFLTYGAAATRVTRECELRLVVNSTFDFPKVGLPILQTDSRVWKKLGLVPSLADVYDLVPWTWLYDWFTGLGDYLHAVEYINSDSSVINYGFATGITRYRIETVRPITVKSYYSKSVDNVNERRDTQSVIRHTSAIEGTVQVRLNLAALSNVSVTSDNSTLSDYQQSILSTLVLSRISDRR